MMHGGITSEKKNFGNPNIRSSSGLVSSRSMISFKQSSKDFGHPLKNFKTEIKRDLDRL
jgi:hypothetical protein